MSHLLKVILNVFQRQCHMVKRMFFLVVYLQCPFVNCFSWAHTLSIGFSSGWNLGKNTHMTFSHQKLFDHVRLIFEVRVTCKFLAHPVRILAGCRHSSLFKNYFHSLGYSLSPDHGVHPLNLSIVFSVSHDLLFSSRLWLISKASSASAPCSLVWSSSDLFCPTLRFDLHWQRKCSRRERTQPLRTNAQALVGVYQSEVPSVNFQLDSCWALLLPTLHLSC